MPDADTWMPKIRTLAQHYDLDMPFSRNGKRPGRWIHAHTGVTDGWRQGLGPHPGWAILIDTEQSFVYREGGLEGVLMAARLAGLSPNLASRFTPGTLISSMRSLKR